MQNPRRCPSSGRRSSGRHLRHASTQHRHIDSGETLFLEASGTPNAPTDSPPRLRLSRYRAARPTALPPNTPIFLLNQKGVSQLGFYCELRRKDRRPPRGIVCVVARCRWRRAFGFLHHLARRGRGVPCGQVKNENRSHCAYFAHHHCAWTPQKKTGQSF